MGGSISLGFFLFFVLERSGGDDGLDRVLGARGFVGVGFLCVLGWSF